MADESNLDSFPVSAIALKCCHCRELVKGVVCYCGEDVCLPCLRDHQKTCGYAQRGIIRCKELKKQQKNKPMGENIRKAVGL